MRLIPDDGLAVVTIWQEAQGEPYTGKVAVGEVILNRMAARYSSDGTVAGTVARRFQFSGWNQDVQDNKLLIRSLQVDDADPVVRECVRAWTEAQGRSSYGVGYAVGAVLYCNLAISKPLWLARVRQVAAIGNHTFFVEGP